MSEVVVGIDLGTTNSLVGAVQGGAASLYLDERGQGLLPSIVGVDAHGALVVGRTARNRRLIDPEGTVSSIKRRMGQASSVRVGQDELTPPQVSALILGALLDRVEAASGARPTRAVITVPAFFDDVQRQATRDAGILAGLVVERLVNEPTAAALSYQTGGEERVLVYDLGGGTFDVSILEREDDYLEVRASVGDTSLGGDDIDGALLEYVLGRLGDARSKVEEEPRARARLLEAVERAKIALSAHERTPLYDPYLVGDGAEAVHLDLELSRSELERVAEPIIKRTLTSIDRALADAKLTPKDLDRVILVGGASKMPLVDRIVTEHLQRRALVDDNADRAVALGASLLAGRIAGEDVHEVLVDITPHSLCVGVVGEWAASGLEGDLDAAPIIKRDTVVPVERARTFFTMADDQEAVSIPIVQGEGATVGENTCIGKVTVSDLPPSAAGSPVEVTFRLDLSGVLDVSATHLSSGLAQTVTITDSPHRLSEQQRHDARRTLESLRARPKEVASLSDADLDLAQAMIARAERALEKHGEGEARGTVQTALDRLRVAVREGHPDTTGRIDDLSDALLDLL